MADPADLANVKFLANWLGADGDTSYSSEEGGALTFNGSTELSTTQTLFGNPVLFCPNSSPSDYVAFGVAEDARFLSDRSVSYTVEVWVYKTTTGTKYFLSTFAGQAGFYPAVTSDGALDYVTRGGSSVSIEARGTAGDVANDAWSYVKMTYNDSIGRARAYVDGVLVAEDNSPSGVNDPNSSGPLSIGALLTSTNVTWGGYIGPIRITEGEALEDTDVPTGVFTGGTPENPATVSLQPAFGAPALTAANDFSALITDYRSFYVMEISGDPIVRIPISSWQATIQSDRASYLQAVIPAADDWASVIGERQGYSSFSVSRLTYINGLEAKSELAKADLETTSYAKGSNNTTVTISGYKDSEALPSSPSTKTLTGLRSITTSSTGTTRVRCDIDWFLRPGDTAIADGESFTVQYINYYVPTSGDMYMDVGDRQ